MWAYCGKRILLVLKQWYLYIFVFVEIIIKWNVDLQFFIENFQGQLGLEFSLFFRLEKVVRVYLFIVYLVDFGIGFYNQLC